MSDFSGKAFEAAEIVDLYACRPPYAAKALTYIGAKAPARARLLDLGCGEGKIARPMTRVFETVTAVDPSANMVALGKTLENGEAENLLWITAKAETAPLKGPIDVVTFASSIHWMEPNALFANLAPHLSSDHRIAIVSGDEAFEPQWASEWQVFLERWVPRATGLPMGSKVWQNTRDRHLDFIDVIETRKFVSDPFSQTPKDFIRCQHSRNSFALSKLGDQAEIFQNELYDLLKPYATTDGMIHYRVATHVTLAQFKATDA